MMQAEAELLAHAQARVGTLLRDKYRIERILGVGGMAVVYVATHRNRQTFAIKMLHPTLSGVGEVRSRFLGEGYRANSVKHKGVVNVLDDDVAEDGSAFLVMELLEGEGVDHLWTAHARRLPVRAALAIAFQVLDVLVAAHAAGVVHRDIKPANLFLTREGVVKVLDFGIARLREATATQWTMTGDVFGTPGFMAPEQALGQSDAIDGQTDVWAVGATLWTLLTGEMVHDGGSAQELVVRAATRPARSLAEVMPAASPGLVEVVDRALAFSKAARWALAADMREAIRRLYLAEFGEDVSTASIAALLGGGSGTLPAPVSDVAAGNALAGRSSRDLGRASDVVASRTLPANGGAGRRKAWLFAVAVGAGAVGVAGFGLASRRSGPPLSEPPRAAALVSSGTGAAPAPTELAVPQTTAATTSKWTDVAAPAQTPAPSPHPAATPRRDAGAATAREASPPRAATTGAEANPLSMKLQ